MLKCNLNKFWQITGTTAFAIMTLVSSVHAHSATPTGSRTKNLGDEFLVSMYETPGFNCAAFCSLSIDKPQIAGIVGSETAWVTPDKAYIWTVKVNPKYTGTATLTYSYVGQDLYYGTDGACLGQGSYTLVINVVDPEKSIKFLPTIQFLLMQDNSIK